MPYAYYWRGNGRIFYRDIKGIYIENRLVQWMMLVTPPVMVRTWMRWRHIRMENFVSDARGRRSYHACTFINTHEHITSSFARGLSIQDIPGLSGYSGQWWTIEGCLLPWSRPGFLRRDNCPSTVSGMNLQPFLFTSPCKALDILQVPLPVCESSS